MAEKANLTRPLILVVDDDHATCRLFARYLQEAGYSTVLAFSGDAAIEQARRLIPDAIVTDVMMPGPGGLQTLFVLRNTPETTHIPAVVVSSISPRILDLMPATAYLVKPVRREELVTIIRDCICSGHTQVH